jgi:hypothetical protein
LRDLIEDLIQLADLSGFTALEKIGKIFSSGEERYEATYYHLLKLSQ